MQGIIELEQIGFGSSFYAQKVIELICLNDSTFLSSNIPFKGNILSFSQHKYWCYHLRGLHTICTLKESALALIHLSKLFALALLISLAANAKLRAQSLCHRRGCEAVFHVFSGSLGPEVITGRCLHTNQWLRTTFHAPAERTHERNGIENMERIVDIAYASM